MRRNVPLAAAAAAALSLAATACADDFTFDYSSPTTTAFGNLSATPNGDGSLSVYFASLHVASGDAAGDYSLIPGGGPGAPFYSPSGYFIVDNQVMPDAAAAMSIYGLLFGGNGWEINIWGNGGPDNYTFYAHHGGTNSAGNGTFTLQAVPAPGAIATASLGGFLLIGRRKRHA